MCQSGKRPLYYVLNLHIYKFVFWGTKFKGAAIVLLFSEIGFCMASCLCICIIIYKYIISVKMAPLGTKERKYVIVVPKVFQVGE